MLVKLISGDLLPSTEKNTFLTKLIAGSCDVSSMDVVVGKKKKNKYFEEHFDVLTSNRSWRLKRSLDKKGLRANVLPCFVCRFMFVSVCVCEREREGER
jgi:hypothetical protein